MSRDLKVCQVFWKFDTLLRTYQIFGIFFFINISVRIVRLLMPRLSGFLVNILWNHKWKSQFK